MKHATLVRKDGMIYAKCPSCKAHLPNPIGVWAAAHLDEILKGACKSCGEPHTIGGH